MCEFTERIFSEGKAEGRAEGEVSANYAAAKRMLLKGNNSLVDCKCKLNKIYQATISVEYTLSRKVSNSSSGL